ncbi:MAG: hypothetical protein VCD66_11430, partial [Alphaproteobacteria bacterium]
KLAKGGKVTIDVAKGKLTFEFRAREKPAKGGKPSGRNKGGGDAGGSAADPETPDGGKIPELVV